LSSAVCIRSAVSASGPGFLLFGDQTDLLQVFRRDRQGDEIPDGFVEAVMGAVLVEVRLILVGALVEIVTEFVVDREEVFLELTSVHILMRTSSLLSRSQADAWQTTSLPSGRVIIERSQKVSGSGSSPSDVKKPSPVSTILIGCSLFHKARRSDRS
jgi:hypothetical protein